LKFLTVFLLVFAVMGSAQAQDRIGEPLLEVVRDTLQPVQDLAPWLKRIHDAAHQTAYVGTFVVTTGHAMFSARIWHVCEGEQQLERVDALSGTPRRTYRRNDQVVTYLPQTRLAIAENRESLGLFASMLDRADSTIVKLYQLQALGHDRVAGFVTDVVELKPRDNLRFGYRIWTVRSNGLVVKLQTIDPMRGVVEQAAFSELQFAKPLSWHKLSAMMDNADGFEVRKLDVNHTTADQEGWSLQGEIPGFRSVSGYKHASAAQTATNGSMQWIFSDGLASVSLFIEPFDEARHLRTQPHETFSVGATQMLTRRVGAWWVVAVGEVPMQTLEMFAMRLERKK
jgi:sigma-E factor negative regulatory protein RseB